MRRILISACLLGLPCRYDGASKPHPAALTLAEDPQIQLIPYCPECYGGLPIPRAPSERCGERVVSANGKDVTAEYRRGAEGALRLCRIFHCTEAVLKAYSPSCGSGVIYDGTFQRKRIPGDGVTAELLKKNGISVRTEEELS